MPGKLDLTGTEDNLTANMTTFDTPANMNLFCSQNLQYLDDRKHRRGVQKSTIEPGSSEDEDVEAPTASTSHKHTR